MDVPTQVFFDLSRCGFYRLSSFIQIYFPSRVYSCCAFLLLLLLLLHNKDNPSTPINRQQSPQSALPLK